MTGWNRKLLFAVCIMIAAVAAPLLLPHWFGQAKSTSALQTAAKPVQSPYAGAEAPDFALTDYNGKKYQLSAFRGKPVLLNFWASWCGPCRMEMPALAATGDQYKGKVEFVGVNLAGQDSEAVSSALLQRVHAHYPNLLDREDRIADLYKVTVLPTTLLLDANGRVVARVQGPLGKEQMEKLFRKVGL